VHTRNVPVNGKRTGWNMRVMRDIQAKCYTSIQIHLLLHSNIPSGANTFYNVVLGSLELVQILSCDLFNCY
jgi:hypothetical protein